MNQSFQIDPAAFAALPPSRPAGRFAPEEYAHRLEAFTEELGRLGCDGAILTSPVTRRYFTGFESTAGTLIVDARKGPVFVVDFRYILMAKKAMPFLRCELQNGNLNKIESLTRKWRNAGFEASESVRSHERLRRILPWIDDWTAVDSLIAELRSVKSPAEQKTLRASIAANDAMFAWIRPQIRPGMTEWDVRGLFRVASDRFAQGESFETIACAGKNGAECHHHSDNTVLQDNEPLLMDFGLLYDHYCSDMTRCLILGKPSDHYRDIYNIVLEANRETVDKLRPGMTGQEVDDIARRIIDKAGYGEHFGHALGHSIGIEIHEGPNFSPGEEREIKPGMIITVEPGIYLPDDLGVRIEDDVLVTETGCECLTQTSRELENP